jgi:hypothetical protein
MFELSPEGADKLLGLSNYGLVLSAIILVFASVGSIWANSVLSRYTSVAIAEANSAAKTADARAEEARLGAATANLEAAKASERAATLEKQTAEITKQAEEARAETAKVKERLQKMQEMRRLTKDKADTLSKIFRSEYYQSEPKLNLRIGSISDAEPTMLAMDFIQLLKACEVNCFPTPGGTHPIPFTQIRQTNADMVLTRNSEWLTHEAIGFSQLLFALDALGFIVRQEVDATLGDREAILSMVMKPNIEAAKTEKPA